MTPNPSEPAVSVVVASFSAEDVLAQCLESLHAWAPTAEHVVATNRPADVVERLAARFPAVRFVPCPPETSVFHLRSIGVAAARGQLIALTEDHCTATAGWLPAFEAARGDGIVVAGGPVDAAAGGPARWALYLCEYAAYMPPLPSGPVHAISAVNAAYDRQALWEQHGVWANGFYDNEVHDALRSAGHPLHLEGRAVVRSHLTFGFFHGMQHMFVGGRRFGGYRKSRSGWGRRLFWMLASPAVPVVLFARIAGQVLARRPNKLGALVLALPWIFSLLTAWSAGEAWGYVAPGPAPANAGRG